MQKSVSNQRRPNSVTVTLWQAKSPLRMLVILKAAFLKNYLAVSTSILNGSSTERHKKKHEQFNLSGVWFGSRLIQFLEQKKISFPLLTPFYNI